MMMKTIKIIAHTEYGLEILKVLQVSHFQYLSVTGFNFPQKMLEIWPNAPMNEFSEKFQIDINIRANTAFTMM